MASSFHPALSGFFRDKVPLPFVLELTSAKMKKTHRIFFEVKWGKSGNPKFSILLFDFFNSPNFAGLIGQRKKRS